MESQKELEKERKRVSEKALGRQGVSFSVVEELRGLCVLSCVFL